MHLNIWMKLFNIEIKSPLLSKAICYQRNTQSFPLAKEYEWRHFKSFKKLHIFFTDKEYKVQSNYKILCLFVNYNDDVLD